MDDSIDLSQHFDSSDEENELRKEERKKYVQRRRRFGYKKDGTFVVADNTMNGKDFIPQWRIELNIIVAQLRNRCKNK